MSELPETIWAYTFDLQQDDMSWGAEIMAWCNMDPSPIIATKYRRADLPPTLSAAAILALIPADTPAAKVTVQAVEALASYQQADMDGVMVLVSRQAIEECLPALRAIAGGRDE